ncbi:MAG: alpha/beta hydrolase [Ancalomicrobiaceae bacterium]|nr:alpha/beta hydrolase [Ancalomicrobiaceae bacterium]
MAVLIFPGLGGSGEGHWQWHWAREIPGAVTVEQSDWAKPDPDVWAATAFAAIRAHPGSVLVGHSLGAVLIAKLSEQHRDLPVEAALLVAPADVEVSVRDHETIRGFGPMPTLPLGFPAMVIASRNDPYMRFERARSFAAMWEAQLIDLGLAGHVNVEAGYGPWREGRLLIDRVAGRRTRPFLISSGPGRVPVAKSTTVRGAGR